jgi:hypothetical protein
LKKGDLEINNTEKLQGDLCNFRKKIKMKKLRYIFLALIVFLAAACFEVNEVIEINKDGSGVYNTKMDMSAMVQMIKSMASEEDLAKNGMGKSLDTVLKMKDIIDSVKDLTPDQKRLLKNGTLAMQMNMDENILKADINFPFSSFKDLQDLMEGNTMASMGSIMKNAMSKGNNESDPPAGPGFEQINSVFDVTVDKKMISRKINKAKYDSLMQRPEMAQMQQMMGAGFEILTTTTIKLPRPVKKSDNPLIKLSADKRTVTLKYDMIKLFKNPEQFSYSIEY